MQKYGELQTSVEMQTHDEVLAVHKSALDWSRDARRQRVIEAAGSDSNQLLVTDYYIVLNEIEQLTRENTVLHDLVKTMNENLRQINNPTSSSFPVMLQHLKNAEKIQEKLHRVEDILKLLKSLLFPCSFTLAQWLTTFSNKTSH